MLAAKVGITMFSLHQRMWQQWINTILGLWIIALPFIGIQSSSAFTWTLAVTGIIVAILAAWGAMEHQETYSERYQM
jgi:hypothetical protein